MFGSLSDWVSSKIPVQLPNLLNNKQNETNESEKKADSQETAPNETEVKQEAASAKAEAAPTAEKPAEEAKKTEEDDKKGEKEDPFANLVHLDKQKAIDTAKNIGSSILSFGMTFSKQIQEKATQLKDVIETKTIIGEFNKENEKFVNEKKVQQRREDAALPPWVGYIEEEKMKKQILMLSKDMRNFISDPPQGVEFPFDFNISYPTALATLDEDPNLKEMRFKLVPQKVTEENFWRNYFYRVSLIKQSTQLNEMTSANVIYFSESADEKASDSSIVAKSASAKSLEKPNNKKEEQYTDNTTEQLVNNEFVSDSYDTTVNEEEIKNELKQLKLGKNVDNDDNDWEKDLNDDDDIEDINADELEKEISQMIGSD